MGGIHLRISYHVTLPIPNPLAIGLEVVFCVPHEVLMCGGVHFRISHHVTYSIPNPIPIGLEFLFCDTHDISMWGGSILGFPTT